MNKSFSLVATTLLLCLCAACAKTTLRKVPLNADLDTMIGQMLMVGFRGTAVNATSPIVQDIRDRHLGTVILFDYDVALHHPQRNISSPEQVECLVTELKKYADIPLLVAVDQEGGHVSRLKEKYGFPASTSAADLGRHNDPSITEKAGALTGKTLARVGINWDLAPVVDVNTNPDCPVIGKLDRSFSPDPYIVITQAKAFITGLHSTGVLSCLKHFPGHGSSMTDSHMGLTDVSGTWSPTELIPYKQMIAARTCDAIMSAHIFNTHLDPDLPATLSPQILTELLRNQLGFTGVILTDDMQMGAIHKHYDFKQAIAQAITAGADMLVFGNNLQYDPNVTRKAIAAIKELVQSGKISQSRIKASFDRIMKLKTKLQAMNPPVQL
ncbi:MAG: glycoside hydrolase family 3 protein [Desulfoplanes sp.]|jgi:beta-N-acetylhexosaminidase|nr:glycoside hydrolase family 3 protein [Desulfoplanes sp.]